MVSSKWYNIIFHYFSFLSLNCPFNADAANSHIQQGERREEGVSGRSLQLEEPEIVGPQAAHHLYHEVVRSQPLNRGGAVMMKVLLLIRAARLSSGGEAGWFAADKCLWLTFALGRGRFLLDERLRPSAATSCQFSVLYGDVLCETTGRSPTWETQLGCA